MSSPVPIELQSKIEHWRKGAAENTLSIEEMKEAIVHLRAGRLAAAAASAPAKRKKAIAEIPSADDLLSELEDL